MLHNARLRNQQPINGGLLITGPCLVVAAGRSTPHMHIGYILSPILTLLGSCASRNRAQYGLVQNMCQVLYCCFSYLFVLKLITFCGNCSYCSLFCPSSLGAVLVMRYHCALNIALRFQSVSSLEEVWLFGDSDEQELQKFVIIHRICDHVLNDVNAQISKMLRYLQPVFVTIKKLYQRSYMIVLFMSMG